RAAEVLTADGRRLFITSALCYHDGRITDTYRRAEAQNAILRAFAASRDDVSYLPLIELVCSGSQLAKINGAEPRPDGVHFSADAARVVWGWLMPYLTGQKDPEAT
ncbi:MAG TPA: hypothetical protein VJM33_03825, partial [Microthrixaceae bacterium]|nr:hypothetical protein [Microthrixaceae bacterium]